MYCICLKKRLGIYYCTGPLGPALKQDGRLFEVGVCYYFGTISNFSYIIINLITNYLPCLNNCVTCTSMNAD